MLQLGWTYVLEIRIFPPHRLSNLNKEKKKSTFINVPHSFIRVNIFCFYYCNKPKLGGVQRGVCIYFYYYYYFNNMLSETKF